MESKNNRKRAIRLRIRDIREDHDYTQTDIAKILNCSQQTYSRYEKRTNKN